MAAQADQTLATSGREILIAVCGGVAAYKVADLVSKMVQAGHGVTVCMTENAQRFVTPLTFQALSGRPVRTSMWERAGENSPDHLALTEEADLLLVAPATANIIAKAAAGICDDLVSTLICASACPVAFAPAMNYRMWQNPICRENVQKLQRAGHKFIGPEEGRMAEGTTGPGRLSEVPAIMAAVARILAQQVV